MTSIPPPLADPFAHVKFDNSLGALLIGVIVSAILFGLTSLQSYLYYTNYPRDRLSFKILVGALWALDALQVAFISHSAYWYLVSNYGNAAALLRGEWSILLEVAATVLIAVFVQLFFAHRAFKLSRDNYFVATFVVILAFVHAGTGFAAVVKLFQIKLFSRIDEALPLMTATLVLMAINDLFITLVLCWYLRKTKSETSFGETHSALRTLMIYTIETGLVTSVTVTIDAICLLTMPHNWIFIAITFSLSKLYVNSFLTILNSRKYLRNQEPSVHKSSGHSGLVHSIRMGDYPPSSPRSPISPFSPKSQLKLEIPPRSIPRGPSVTITTETLTVIEPGYAI